jgi:hypothetical protein
VAVWEERGTVSGLTSVQDSLDGSNSSALERNPLMALDPPAMRTCPLVSRVAVCPARGVFRE